MLGSASYATFYGESGRVSGMRFTEPGTYVMKSFTIFDEWPVSLFRINPPAGSRIHSMYDASIGEVDFFIPLYKLNNTASVVWWLQAAGHEILAHIDDDEEQVIVMRKNARGVDQLYTIPESGGRPAEESWPYVLYLDMNWADHEPYGDMPGEKRIRYYSHNSEHGVRKNSPDR